MAFNSQVAHYERKIRQETIFWGKSPRHVFGGKNPRHLSNVTFWDLLTALLIDSMRLRKGFLWNFEVFRAFPHSDGTKSWFCPWSNTHIALLQSNWKRLMKILKSCLKSSKRLCDPETNGWDIFIVQYNFTDQITQPLSVTKFRAL